jgi:hypothetical protein
MAMSKTQARKVFLAARGVRMDRGVDATALLALSDFEHWWKRNQRKASK